MRRSYLLAALALVLGWASLAFAGPIFLASPPDVERDTGEKYRHEATPYDQASTDNPYILRMMMFYEEAGGRSYTGLWNAYQSFVDLSTLLKADRAILVAEVPDGVQEKWRGADLLRDGRPLGGAQNKHVTLCRFVFPVKRGNGSGER